MSYRLTELCCGTAALSMHLCGMRRSLLPYQGAKWRIRKAIAAVMSHHGFEGSPTSLHLNDLGPWGDAWAHITAPEVLKELEIMVLQDPKVVFDYLQRHPVSPPPVSVAELLFLQRLSHSGKAVGIREGRWNSPGFNESSAYGIPATDRFGAIRPMVPYLIEVLEQLHALDLPSLVATQLPADKVPVYKGRQVVYLDPPYEGSTGYPNGAPFDLVQTALTWGAAGALVLVSEATPMKALLAEGWDKVRIDRPKSNASPFKTKGEEWLTHNGRAYLKI